MAMTITRWRPLGEMDELRRRMEHLLDGVVAGDGDRQWNISIDLIERDDKYVLRADVPGVKPDEIKVEVADDVLTISASHDESQEEKKDDYVRRERRYGSFSRSIALPKGVTADDVEATCHDGVLEISFPKPKEEEPKAVTITPKST